MIRFFGAFLLLRLEPKRGIVGGCVNFLAVGCGLNENSVHLRLTGKDDVEVPSPYNCSAFFYRDGSIGYETCRSSRLVQTGLSTRRSRATC